MKVLQINSVVKITWVLRMIVAMILLETLLFKFTAHPDSVKLFTILGVKPYLRVGLGIVELVTAILILIPKSSFWAMLFALILMFGALLTHLFIIGLEFNHDHGVLFALALICFLSVTLYFILNKKQLAMNFNKHFNIMNHIWLFIAFIMISFSGCAQNAKTAKKEDQIAMETPKMQLSDEQWKAKLTPEQYYILREKGTEPAFSGEFYLTKEAGTYKCAACGEPLFTDDMKFESHCGWPSFDREIEGGKIIQQEDRSHGMRRTEIICANCGSHLGHIFEDGPTNTGKRYCVNSVSLSFEPKNQAGASQSEDTITLAGGCFWCIEAIYDQLKGVKSAVSGYSGGKKNNPSYKQVCTGNTGHAEAVQITYDPSVISLEELLEVFFTLHDPTTLNRQGADVGTQYRSAIFYQNEAQKQSAEKTIATLNQDHAFDKPIVTEVTAFTNFYPAENYHQEYYELNKEQPYCKSVILPKMEKLHKIFNDKLKKN